MEVSSKEGHSCTYRQLDLRLPAWGLGTIDSAAAEGGYKRSTLPAAGLAGAGSHLRHAHQPRKPLRAAHAGQQAQPHLGQAQLRACGARQQGRPEWWMNRQGPGARIQPRVERGHLGIWLAGHSATTVQWWHSSSAAAGQPHSAGRNAAGNSIGPGAGSHLTQNPGPSPPLARPLLPFAPPQGAPSAATRALQAIAISRPPPRAGPSMAATVGFDPFSSRAASWASSSPRPSRMALMAGVPKRVKSNPAQNLPASGRGGAQAGGIEHRAGPRQEASSREGGAVHIANHFPQPACIPNMHTIKQT